MIVKTLQRIVASSIEVRVVTVGGRSAGAAAPWRLAELVAASRATPALTPRHSAGHAGL